MGKLFTFFVLIFSVATIMSAIMEQETAFATTTLSTAIDEDDTSIEVTATDDFLDSGYIWIGDERIQYSSKDDSTDTFTVAASGRGVADDNDEGGTASSHSVGDKVLSEKANIINVMLGYNRMATRTEIGIMEYPMFLWKILTVAIPKMIMWDYSYLEGNLVLLKYTLLYAISAGFLISFVGWVVPLVRSILPY